MARASTSIARSCRTTRLTMTNARFGINGERFLRIGVVARWAKAGGLTDESPGQRPGNERCSVVPLASSNGRPIPAGPGLFVNR